MTKLHDLTGLNRTVEDFRRSLERGGSGDGGGNGGNELGPRLDRLEKSMSDVESDVKTIRNDLSYIKGKLDGMPTTLQLVAFAVAVFVAAGVFQFFR